MSNKTRTRKTRTTVGTNSPDRTLRPVPDQTITAKARTDTEDKLWEALHANPNSTAAALSMAAKIGRSTAQKILATWAGDGSVTRTAGIAEGGRRAADLWTIAETDTVRFDPGKVSNTPANEAASDDTARADTVVSAAPFSANDTAPDHAQDRPDTEATDPTHAQSAVDEAIKSTDDGMATAGTTTAGESVARMAPGALRGLVEDHLRDHPHEEFGPTAIAKALAGKSSGAVSNALDKLVADGTAVKTKDKPRRFALAPAEQAAIPASTN
jgi:hypothetical protein